MSSSVSTPPVGFCGVLMISIRVFAVMSEVSSSSSLLHRADCRLDDVGGRGEIRLADLQVDDPLAFGFELARPGEDFERALGPQSGHALGETNRGAHGLNPIRWC